MKENEFEERLVHFVISIFGLCENLSRDYASEYLSHQMMQAASTSALTYGVAMQTADNQRKRIHLLRVRDKLRETCISLQILYLASLCDTEPVLSGLVDENIVLLVLVKEALRESAPEQSSDGTETLSGMKGSLYTGLPGTEVTSPPILWPGIEIKKKPCRIIVDP